MVSSIKNDPNREKLLKSFESLYTTISQLRNPDGGCPWDLKQTHTTLLPYLIEESYEYIAAVEKNDPSQMREEIGDVLLQVLLHTVMATQEGKFNLADVMDGLNAKMIQRHPHVFGEEAKNRKDYTMPELHSKWDAIKAEEKKKEPSETFDSSYLKLPALQSAFKIGQKTGKLKFDWEGPMQVLYKVEEEWQELKEEVYAGKQSTPRIEEELGDFLFSAAQLARHMQMNPEEVLRKANQKFIRRFNAMEALAGKKLDGMSTEKMEELWERVKSEELKA